MKRKLISILLVISIFAVSVPAAFASENGSIEKTDPLSVAVFGGDTLSLSLGSVSSGDSGDITTLGNERDKFKTIIKYGSWEPAKTFTITKSQAKTEATFRNALHILYTSTMSIFGGLVGVIASLHSLFINSFYADPSEAAGKYTVKRRSTTKYQQNILTGKSAIIEKGYQFQITHNGKTVNKTF